MRNYDLLFVYANAGESIRILRTTLGFGSFVKNFQNTLQGWAIGDRAVC